MSVRHETVTASPDRLRSDQQDGRVERDTRAINVVVTCTDRKRRSHPPELRARVLPPMDPAARVAAWVKRLEASMRRDDESRSPKALPAEALYAGDHWAVVRTLQAVGAEAGHVVRTWVCSAGYGLVELTTPLLPYAATFVQGHADSVVSKAIDRSAWWHGLTEWSPHNYTGPRSITALAQSGPSTPILVAASGAYLGALTDDLRRAAAALDTPDYLRLVSIGAPKESSLAPYLLPGDARLKAAVGGAMHSINVRVLRRILAESLNWYPDHNRLVQLIDRWLDAAPGLQRYSRNRLADDEVRAYIREALTRDPAISRTALLVGLRASGRACEQARFATLYREVLRSLEELTTEQLGRS